MQSGILLEKAPWFGELVPLDGNSNEWRYVPVRRFFIFAEESIKKATEPFVFAPNDANTWLRGEKYDPKLPDHSVEKWRPWQEPHQTRLSQ